MSGNPYAIKYVRDQTERIAAVSKYRQSLEYINNPTYNVIKIVVRLVST